MTDELERIREQSDWHPSAADIQNLIYKNWVYSGRMSHREDARLLFERNTLALAALNEAFEQARKLAKHLDEAGYIERSGDGTLVELVRPFLEKSDRLSCEHDGEPQQVAEPFEEAGGKKNEI